MSLKKSRNRSFNVFNLSFLDIMSCGLGAVILIFLILKHGDSLPSDQEQLIYNDIKNIKDEDTINLPIQSYLVHIITLFINCNLV